MAAVALSTAEGSQFNRGLPHAIPAGDVAMVTSSGAMRVGSSKNLSKYLHGRIATTVASCKEERRIAGGRGSWRFFDDF
ncbi:MAG: hypothetical protein Fues2KO_02210 [Fuerstiella sp.]